MTESKGFLYYFLYCWISVWDDTWCQLTADKDCIYCNKLPEFFRVMKGVKEARCLCVLLFFCLVSDSFFVHVKDLKSYEVHAKESYSLPQKTLTCLNILVIVQPFLHLLAGGMYDRTTSSSVISDHPAQRSLVNLGVSKCTQIPLVFASRTNAKVFIYCHHLRMSRLSRLWLCPCTVTS